MIQTPSASSPAPRRRRWLSVILGVLAALMVVLASLAVFVQTNFAFQHLIVPIASSHMEGDLEIESGRISLTGGLTLKGIRLSSMPPIESLTVDSFEARISLPSLLGGGVPRIQRVSLVNPSIVLDGSVGSREAEGKAGEGERKPPRDQDGEKGKPSPDGPMLPVAIDEVRLDNLSATLKHEGRVQARLAKVNFALRDLSSGSSATAKLNADFEIAPDDADQARSGTMALSLKVEQPEDGRSFRYEGSSLVAVQEGTPRADGGVTADLKLDMTTLKGSLSREGIIQCSLEALASTAQEQAGSVSLALDYDRKSNKIQGDVEITRIGREVLNPILAVYGPAEIESARFDTKITVQNEGENFRFLSKLAGKELSVRPEKGQQPTPKLDISSEHAGLWNPKTRMLTVEKAEVVLTREGKRIGEAGLDQALALNLDSAKEGAASGLAPKEARVTVKIDDLEVENVRPWLKAFNSEALEPVRSGGLDGKLTATIYGAGESIEWNWEADVKNLRVRPGKDGDTLGPFSVSQQVAGSIKDMKSIVLTQAAASVRAEDGEIATAQLSGTHAWESGATDLKVRVSSPHLGRALRGVGALKDGGKFEVREGAVVNDVTLQRAGKNDPILVSGGTKVDGLGLVADGKRTLGQSFASVFEAKISGDARNAELTKFEMAMNNGAGVEAGRIVAQGYWPLKFPEEGEKPGKDGRATVKISGVSAAPWIKFLDLGDGRDLGDVPVNGDLAVSVDPKGERFTYDGQWETTIQMDRGGVAEEVRVTVENSVRKLNDEIESFVANLNAARGSGTPDKVAIQGKGRLGERPAIQADVKVASMDAGFFADAFAPKQDKSDEGSKQKESRGGASDPASVPSGDGAGGARSEEFPADINVTFAVDRLLYRDVNVSAMSGSVISDAKTLKARLDGMKVNEGNLAGHADLAHAAEGLKMAWQFQGSGIDIGPVVNSLSESQRDKIEGRLTFNTQGAGVRVKGAERPDVDGMMVFDLADGQLKNSKLLNTISEATGTNVFNQLVYKGIHGDVTLADGWANLNKMVVDGNATRLIMDGRIGLDGELEVDVQPAIGPEVKDTMGSENKFKRYLGTIAGTTSDFLAFPIAVTARGKVSDPKYMVKPKLPPGVSDLGELLGGAVGGLLEGGRDGGKDLIEGIGGAVGGLTKGLLDRKKKD